MLSTFEYEVLRMERIKHGSAKVAKSRAHICSGVLQVHTILSDIVWIPAFIPALLHVKKLVSVWSN